jgi:AcrR family transcriptional regulator
VFGSCGTLYQIPHPAGAALRHDQITNDIFLTPIHSTFSALSTRAPRKIEEFESKEALFLACLRHYLNTRESGALLTAEPLGWGNIERFLEEAPSCALDQRGCFIVNSMRELDCLPAEARKVIAYGSAKLKELVRANVAAEKPRMDVKSLCELISAFFSGICIEANLTPDRKRARRKIRDFMQMLRAA